jgi:hypothetical protein
MSERERALLITVIGLLAIGVVLIMWWITPAN